jgi:hypothetical protein
MESVKASLIYYPFTSLFKTKKEFPINIKFDNSVALKD